MKRRFRIVLIRSKGEVLGMVEATDAQATREKVAAIGCWCRSWAENELSGKARQAAAASSESSELLTYVPPPQDLTWRAQPSCGRGQGRQVVKFANESTFPQLLDI